MPLRLTCPGCDRTIGTGYLLYGVGPNGRDDGGRGPDAQPPGDDIAVGVPVPEPRR